MTVFLIVIAFFAGAVYGYAKSIEHCDKCHGQSEETPRFKGPF